MNTTKTETTKNQITFINLKNPENASFLDKLRSKIGPVIDDLSLYAFQHGQELLSFKYHEKQKKLFAIYPSFNLISSQTSMNIYLKRKGEKFPTKSYKVKKTDVKKTLEVDEINDYINESVVIEDMLKTPLKNETILVLDNLKIGVLLKNIEKEKVKAKITTPTTYEMVYDMIDLKLNEVLDSGYLNLLNMTCVMMYQTFTDSKNIEFKSNELNIKAPKKETKSKVKKSKDKVKDSGKDETPIPEFSKPNVEDLKPLKNINDIEIESDKVEINKETVNSILSDIDI